MLTGTELGRAIKDAIRKRGVKQTEVAAHFSVKPPSVQTWIRKGTVAKEKLPELWRYFSDTVGPEHWGLERFPWTDEAARRSEVDRGSGHAPEPADAKGMSTMQLIPTIGATIQHLGALLSSMSPMARKSIRPLIDAVLDNPEESREAATTADAIASSQKLPLADQTLSRSLGESHKRPANTGLGELS